MASHLFSLALQYEGNPETHFVYGTSQQMLVMIGEHHHDAATIKPVMTLRNDTGGVIAQMDDWATEWVFVGAQSIADVSEEERHGAVEDMQARQRSYFEGGV